MTDRLARLLAPTSVDVFLDHFFGRRHLYLATDSPGRLDEALKIDDIDRLFQSRQLPAAFIDVVEANTYHPREAWSRTAEGEKIAMPEKLLDLYAAGSTIIINKAFGSIPSLNTLTRQLSAELGFLIGANIYITPPAATGFHRHGDTHDVLILQISGSKNWIVHETGGAPADIVLNRGDAIFIPGKMEHEARCCDSHSIHVSLSLNPTFEFQLLEELAAIASEDALFQVPLAPPLRTIAPGYNADFSARVQGLLSRTTVASLIERRFQMTVDSAQQYGSAVRFSDMLYLSDVTPDTVVCARAGVTARIVPAADSLTVHFAGKEVRMPVFLRSCVDRILIGQPFAIRELQGLLTDASRVELVKPFIRTGLLTIVRL